MKQHSFRERFESLMQRHGHVHTTPSLWMRTLLWSLVVFCISTNYILLANGWDGLKTLNQALANTAFLLVGFSMMMSSVCYFWDFADHMIVYRKHAGLVGFWYVMLHGILSFALVRFDFSFFLLSENILAFSAAVIATAILIMMAVISNRFAIQELGGKNWRRLLRTGYIVILFGMLHMILKAWPQWELWVTTPRAIPPMSFLVAIFLMIVLCLRLALWYRLAQNKKKITA